MKFVAVDIQGFCTPDFQPKELAIYDGKEMKSYIFKPKIPWRSLPEDSKKQAKYLYGNHHGLHYNYGETAYDDLYSIIYNNLRDVDTIYVKGRIKQDFLVKIFNELKYNSSIIVNLENISSNIPKFQKGHTICSYHDLDICVCSVKNAELLYNCIVNSSSK